MTDSEFIAKMEMALSKAEISGVRLDLFKLMTDIRDDCWQLSILAKVNYREKLMTVIMPHFHKKSVSHFKSTFDLILNVYSRGEGQ